MWSVILADDERYVLTGLQTLIPWQDFDCEVVAEASGGQELLQKVEKLGADIVVLDISMPGLNGLDAAAMLRRSHPEIILIFLTGYEDFQYARAAIGVGAAAYIVKTEVLEELPAALRAAVETLRKSRVAPESPAMIALMRSLCDGTFAIRRNEEGFQRAFDTLQDGFPACRLLAVEWQEAVEPGDLENLTLLLESSLSRFSPTLFPMEGTRLCLLLRRADVSPEDIAAECEALLPVAESFCGLKLATAISLRFERPDGMREAYTEISRLLAQRLRDGDTHIHFTRDEAAASQEPTYGALTELLTRAEPGELDAWMDGLIASLRDTDLIAARGECLRALSSMAMVCYRYSKQLSPPDGEDYNAAVLTAQTLAQLRKALSAAMRSTVALISRENEKIHALVKATNDYIAIHAYEKVSLADIANAVHANPSHLSRFYKEKTGRNLFDVINAMRVERAMELMRTTDCRTYEIAEAVGFSDTSNFSKFFKKHTGTTPREYARGERRDRP